MNYYMGNPTNPPIFTQPPQAYIPPGLYYLTNVNQLFVKQTVEVFEVITGFETNNRYKILNTMGQVVFKAVEVNDCCTLNCCGKNRPFDMNVYDNGNMEVMHFEKPLGCDKNCCFPFCCCGYEILAFAPPGNYIGRACQTWSCCTGRPRFEVLDQNDEAQLRVSGDCCTFAKCCSVHYRVYPMDNHTQIGVITKQWEGMFKGALTDADNFGVSFPLDLEVKMKALLLALTILIDYMFYEK